MALNVVVCVKQVVDPETPVSAFKIDPVSKQVVPVDGIPPVVNGFDENAVEAALRIKDHTDVMVTAVSVGCDFVMDVMKKPLAMGVDKLVLVDDVEASNLDASATAYVLSEAIKNIGDYDLVICGRQASDWDNAHVPLGVAELLGIPCVSVVQKIEIMDQVLSIQASLDEGYEIVQASMPSLVTVSNELGEPRYPTLRGIMSASRKSPTIWNIQDLNLDVTRLAPSFELLDLFIPISERSCELIQGKDDEDAGRNLALRLRQENLL